MNDIHPAPVRDTVQVRLQNGRAYDGPKGTTIEDFLQFITEKDIKKYHVVAAFCGGSLRELSQPLMHDAKLVPVNIGDADGARIYRRSLCFLMVAAASQLMPEHTITIQHSMPFGGYYCEGQNGEMLTDDELSALRTRMQELVEQDLPINKITIPLHEALQIFKDNGDMEKAELFARRRKDYLTLYELLDFRDYFHGFMVPSTGYLDMFELHHYNDGFILQFPRRHAPDLLQPFEDEPRLAKVFQDYNDWLSIIGVPSVAALNHALNNGRCQEVILVAEAFHMRQL
ncbi:MAG: nucleoside kinase, partial [Chloroflexi bacterium]